MGGSTNIYLTLHKPENVDMYEKHSRNSETGGKPQKPKNTIQIWKMPVCAATPDLENTDVFLGFLGFPLCFAKPTSGCVFLPSLYFEDCHGLSGTGSRGDLVSHQNKTLTNHAL